MNGTTPEVSRNADQAQRSDAVADQIARTFSYHAPKGDQAARYEAMRAKAREFAMLIHASCPHSRERSTALTELQSVVMWANAAIACNE